MQDKDINNFINSQIDKTPSQLREAILECPWAEKIIEIAKEKELTNEEKQKIGKETILLLLGATNPLDFEVNIENALKENKTKTKEVTNEINNRILDEIYKNAKKKGLETPSETELQELREIMSRQKIEDIDYEDFVLFNQYQESPEKVKEFLREGELPKKIQDTGEKFSLTEEEKSIIESVITTNILFATNAEKIKENLREKLVNKKNSFSEIYTDLENKIIKPAIKDLGIKEIDTEKVKKGVLNEHLNKLSPNIQSVIDESDYQTKIYIVGKKHNLTIAQISELEEIVTKTILGQISGDVFEESIKNTLGLATEKVILITQELNEKVLREIRNKVLDLGGKQKDRESDKLPPTLPKVDTEQGTPTQNTLIPKVQKQENKDNIDSILSKKLSGAFKMGGATTEYSLNNISKQNEIPNGGKENKAKTVDPYRMPIE